MLALEKENQHVVHRSRGYHKSLVYPPLLVLRYRPPHPDRHVARSLHGEGGKCVICLQAVSRSATVYMAPQWRHLARCLS